MGQDTVDLMIDFETLDTVEGAVLLSLGMVAFTQDKVLYGRYEEFSLTNQILAGRTVSRDTLDWWKKTNCDELRRLLYDGDRLPQFVIPGMYESMTSQYKVRNIWSRGNIDYVWLQEFIDVPYWKHKDCRTLDVFMKMKGANNHNALDDCKNQIAHVQGVLKEWNEPVVKLKD